MRSPTSTPIVSCCCLKISFLFFATVIIFFTAGLLLCFEHVDHWELIASRWRPALSSHLISPDRVFDASLVPGTCPGRFLDLKGLINKFLESRLTGQVQYHDSNLMSGYGVKSGVAR